jgi:hypothetical protein
MCFCSQWPEAWKQAPARTGPDKGSFPGGCRGLNLENGDGGGEKTKQSGGSSPAGGTGAGTGLQVHLRVQSVGGVRNQLTQFCLEALTLR